MLDGMRSGAHSFVIKIAFGLIILVFIFWGIGSNTSNSGIVAKVNGEPITINEFQQAYNQMANEIKSVIPDLTEEQLKSFQLENRVLQNVIIRKLFLSEAKRIGLDVSAKELRDTLMALPFFHDESGKFSAELYEQRLKAFGQSSAVFENNLRLDLLPQKFQEVVTAGVFGDKNIAQKMFAFQGERRSMDYVLFPFEMDKQNVSDAEAKAVYEERKELFTVPAQVSLEFINFTPALMADENAVTVEEIKAYYDDNQAKFSEEEQVKARHILLMAEPDAPKSENDKILSRLQDIASQIKTVEDFAKMAQQYGQDGTKNSGGDLGWFGKSQMVQEFADVAFALPENTLSEPVRTQFGYHLIWVDDKKEGRQIPFEEVKDRIKHDIAVERVNANLAQTVDSAIAAIMANGNMEDEAKKYNLKVTKTGFVDIASLADTYNLRQSDVDALVAMENGNVWDSAVTLNDELSVVKLVEKKASSVQPFEAVKAEIAAELKMKKAQESAKEKASQAVFGYDKNAPENIKTSSFFTREGQVEHLGPLPELAKEIFAADEKTWLKHAYVSDEGAVVARLNTIKSVGEGEFEKIADDVLLNMQDAQKNMLFQAYILMLNQEANVDILMPELFAKQ
ncbi:MAG TPA: hypothetical protein DEB43_04000 [Desulfovibrio sp.]|nr:hypothetical protein [Desulfovibrio sp.]